MDNHSQMFHMIIDYDPQGKTHEEREQHIISTFSLVYGNLIECIKVANDVATITITQGFYTIVINKTTIILTDNTTTKNWVVYDASRKFNCEHAECVKEHHDWEHWLEFNMFDLLHDLIQTLTVYYDELNNWRVYPSPDSIMCIKSE
jgi:hypothetical protein